MAAFKYVGNRTLNYGLVQIGFRFVLGHSAPYISSHYDFDDRGAIAMLQNGATDRAVGKLKVTLRPSVSSESPVVKIFSPLTRLFARTYA